MFITTTVTLVIYCGIPFLSADLLFPSDTPIRKRFLEFANSGASIRHDAKDLQQHMRKKTKARVEGVMRRKKRKMTSGPSSGCQTPSSKLMSLLVGDSHKEGEGKEEEQQKDLKKDGDDDGREEVHRDKRGKANDGR